MTDDDLTTKSDHWLRVGIAQLEVLLAATTHEGSNWATEKLAAMRAELERRG